MCRVLCSISGAWGGGGMAANFQLLPAVNELSDDDVAAPSAPAPSNPKPKRQKPAAVTKSMIERCLLKVVQISCDCQKQRARSRRTRSCFAPFKANSRAFHDLVALRFSWSSLHKLDADNKVWLQKSCCFPFLTDESVSLILERVEFLLRCR